MITNQGYNPNIDAMLIFNQLPGSFLVLLPDAPRFTIVAISDAYLAATYLQREESLNKGVFEALTDNPNYKEATGVVNLLASLNLVIAGKVDHRMEDQRYDVLNPRSNEFELRIWRPLNRPVLNAAGNVQYIIHMVEDVTEYIRLRDTEILTSKKLGESQDLFRSMIEQAPVAMCYIAGLDHVVNFANDHLLKQWNKSKGEVLNRSIVDIFPNALEQGLIETLISVYSTGKTYTAVERPLTRSRGDTSETIYHNWVYEPLRNTHGTILGIMVMAIEITNEVVARLKVEEMVAQRTSELADANEILPETNQELQRSNANLEEFAHATSHDLKEPIRKIQFYNNQLRNNADHYTANEKKYIDRIELATGRMKNLIDDLLLYSYVRQVPHEKQPVDLNEILQQALDDLELDILAKNAVITSGLLPTIQGYKRQLQQVFQNLLSNALKYSKPTEQAVIKISASEVDYLNQRHHQLSFEDNGIGFDTVYAEKIFVMFARLHNKSEYGGTGVGLSIVKKVVENHNGIIEVESVPGEGSTFRLYFPI